MENPILGLPTNNIGQTKKPGKKLKWLFIALLMLGVISTGSWFGWQKFHDSSPIPKNIRQSVSFPLYYPKTLPPTFKLNKGSFASSGQVVTYSFSFTGSDAKSYNLAVTIEPAVPNLTSTANFNPSDQFITNIGSVYLVELETRTSAAIVTSKSTVFLNTTGGISQDNLKQFINSLTKVQ